MILVDWRDFSDEPKSAHNTLQLRKLLTQAGYPCEKIELEFADLAWEGRGIGGTPVMVGVEVKKLSDLIQSLRDKRLNKQVAGMCKDYESRCWLFVLGEWTHDDTGALVQFHHRYKSWVPVRGGMSAMELEKRIYTLEIETPLRVHYFRTPRDLVRGVGALYHRWIDQDQDAHTSHLHPHDKPLLIPISPFREAVMKWPGIGLAGSKAVEDYFGGSLRQAIKAKADEWADVPVGKNSRRLGPKAADTLMRFFN